MKNKLLLTIAVFLFVLDCGHCVESKLNSRLNITAPDSVAQKANQVTTNMPPSFGILNDPVVNSMMTGYGNMVQGASGGVVSPNEQTKRQMDYARLQMKEESD